MNMQLLLWICMRLCMFISANQNAVEAMWRKGSIYQSDALATRSPVQTKAPMAWQEQITVERVPLMAQCSQWLSHACLQVGGLMLAVAIAAAAAAAAAAVPR